MAKEEKLLKILKEIAIKEDYAQDGIDIKPISSGGANYTTDLYLVTFSDPPKPDINMFVKVANLSEAARVANVYMTETLFYTELADNFERLYNKHNVPVQDRLAIPKYFGHSLIPCEETLVLENLEARGFKNFDRMKPFNWEYAASAVTQLARYHALGLAFKEESPQEFERIVSNFKADYMEDQEMMGQMMQQTIQNVCSVLSEDHSQRLQKFLMSLNPLELIETSMKDKTFLIHGDFKPSNLMHRRRNGKLELITLDFQMLRLGNPTYDLMMLIFSGSDAEFRRLYYQRLMDHYYTELRLALKKLDVDIEKVYPKKTFDNDLVENRPYGVLLSLIVVGMVMVDPEDAPTFDGDISSIQVKFSQIAKDRLIGIIKDYIKWGVL